MNERFEIFTVLIAKISRNIRKIKNREMAEYDLRGPHISCLYYLYAAKSLTVTELAERCEEDKATISRSVDFLEKNGYLMREAKRYRSRLFLTEKGQAIGKRIADKIRLVVDELSAGFSDEERRVLYRCLGIISKRLDAIGESLE